MSKLVNRWVAYDQRWFFFVNKQLRNKLFDIIMPRLTHMGGGRFLLSLLAIVFLLSEGELRLWTVQALFSLMVSHLIARVIKKAWARTRPYNALANAMLTANPMKDYSFPSGHTTAAFSVAVIYSLQMPVLTVFLLALAFMISMSRMYLGLHYPSDCISGVILGAGTSILTLIFWGKLTGLIAYL